MRGGGKLMGCVADVELLGNVIKIMCRGDARWAVWEQVRASWRKNILFPPHWVLSRGEVEEVEILLS